MYVLHSLQGYTSSFQDLINFLNLLQKLLYLILFVLNILLLLLLLLSYSITKLGFNNSLLVFFCFVFVLYFWNLLCLRDHNENKAFCLFYVIPAKKTQFAFVINNCYAFFFSAFLTLPFSTLAFSL